MTNLYNINNIPEYAYEYQYIVARGTYGDLWFWGAYETYEEAEAAVKETHGYIFEMAELPILQKLCNQKNNRG